MNGQVRSGQDRLQGREDGSKGGSLLPEALAVGAGGLRARSNNGGGPPRGFLRSAPLVYILAAPGTGTARSPLEADSVRGRVREEKPGAGMGLAMLDSGRSLFMSDAAA